MISRTYTIYHADGKVSCYKGFNKEFYTQPKPERIAIVFVQGEIDVYALDSDKQAEQEFLRFLKTEDQYSDPSIVYNIYRVEN